MRIAFVLKQLASTQHIERMLMSDLELVLNCSNLEAIGKIVIAFSLYLFTNNCLLPESIYYLIANIQVNNALRCSVRKQNIAFILLIINIIAKIAIKFILLLQRRRIVQDAAVHLVHQGDIRWHITHSTTSSTIHISVVIEC